MLEKLFSSKTRVKLLKLFLAHPDEQYYVRQLTRKLDERINSIRRELANLEEVGLLQRIERDRKVFYQVDSTFYCLPEFQNLFAKVSVGPHDRLIREIKSIGGVQYAMLSGFFTHNEESKVDVFLVGNLDKMRVGEVMELFEKEFDREINYAVMTADEFEFRKKMQDSFIKDLFTGQYQVVVDSLGGQKEAVADVKVEVAGV